MFGRYDRCFSITGPEIRVQIEERNQLPCYIRDCNADHLEKFLINDYDAIHIHPVEPVNLPAEITHFLEISFPTIVLPPLSDKRIFLKFPVEIGVFFETHGKMHLLDIFSLAPTKFSLYGSPSSGYITRWYRSDLYPEIPVTDMSREGVLELSLINQCSSTIEISRVVLNSHYMQIYYGDHVGMTGKMTIVSSIIAETTFVSISPSGCVNRSIDLYTARNFSVGQSKGFLMDAGMT